MNFRSINSSIHHECWISIIFTCNSQCCSSCFSIDFQKKIQKSGYFTCCITQSPHLFIFHCCDTSSLGVWTQWSILLLWFHSTLSTTLLIFCPTDRMVDSTKAVNKMSILKWCTIFRSTALSQLHLQKKGSEANRYQNTINCLVPMEEKQFKYIR